MKNQEHHNLFWITHALIEAALGEEEETSLIDYDNQTFEVKWESSRFSQGYLLFIKRQNSKLPGYIVTVEEKQLIVPTIGYYLLVWDAEKTRGKYA